MDVNVIYDGTWAGLLTTVFETYEHRWDVKAIRSYDKPGQQDVFTQETEVITDPVKAARVWKGLQCKVPAAASRHLYCCYLSEQGGVERVILSCIQFYFSGVKDPHLAYANNDVLRITQLAKSVDRERHRMKAFIRFQRVDDDVYYAGVEPDFNVLPLIIDHFRDRYADQRWLIYDLKRKYGIYYDLNTVEEVSVAFSEGLNKGSAVHAVFHESEQLYQDLWKDYFRYINISERKNMKLHLQHVPRRYWGRLTEKG